MAKKDRFIYLIRHSILTQACLKVKCWVVNDKALTVFFAINCERTGV